MKVLLVEPPAGARFSRERGGLFALVAAADHRLPLGLAYLAAALEARGHEALLLDLNLEPLAGDELIARVRESGAGLVGVANNFTATAPAALALLRTLRDRLPELPLVTGGLHATFCADEALAAGAQAVVLFEAELTLPDLADAVAAGAPLEGVPGLCLPTPAGSARTPPRPLPRDLDALPLPALGRLELGNYRGGVLPVGYPVISTRGCNYACYYCTSPAFTRTVRVRSVGHVAAELELALASGFARISFHDDNMAHDRDRFVALCDVLRARGLRWGFNARAEQLDPPLLDRAHDSGCDAFLIGIESGSAAVRRTIKRQEELGPTRALVRRALELGLHVVCSFTFPHHCDTLETTAETMRLMEELADEGAVLNVTLTTPFPGTRLYQNPGAYGVELLTRDWAAYDLRTPVFRTAAFDAPVIARLFAALEELFIDSAGRAAKRWLGQRGVELGPLAQLDTTALLKALGGL